MILELCYDVLFFHVFNYCTLRYKKLLERNKTKETTHQRVLGQKASRRVPLMTYFEVSKVRVVG
jgi:hypothetical protein